MNLSGKLTSFFSKESLQDGRIVIAIALFIYFLSVLCSSLFTDYYKYWRILGVPAAPDLFIDLKGVTLAIKCPGADPFSSNTNPCNTWFAYPKIWLWISPIWVSSENANYLGFALIGIFYFTLFILLGKINVNSGIYYSLLLCSPPMMLAIERAQPDLIIFILCGLAIWCMKKKWPVYWASLLLMLSGFLKLYPLITAISLLNENKKASIRVAAILLSVAITYILFNWGDIQSLNNSLNKNYWSTSVGFLHGCIILFTLLNNYSFFNQAFQLVPYATVAYLTVVAVIIFTFLIARKKKTFIYNTDHIFSFKVGTLLYISSFFIGNNYDYKFIIFLFTIPQLIVWTKSTSQANTTALLCLFAILFTCWSVFLSHITYWLVYTLLEESLNWFILGYFIFMLFNTIPIWLKKMLKLPFSTQ